MAREARVPNAPAEISVEWLAQCLRNAGLNAATGMSDVHVEIIGEERGFTGVVARLTPRYARAAPAAPRSIIAKFPLARRASATSYQDHLATDPALARRSAERCAREVRFYELSGRSLSQIPDFYAGHADIDAGRVALLLEDLVDCEAGDALAGCTVAEARPVLHGLGELHARWWGDAELSTLDWLDDWSASIPGRVERFPGQARLVAERYGERLPEGVLDLLVALPARLQPILEALAAAPSTLVHGDMHLDNVMFDSTGAEHKAYIIDWQGVARGPALLDVAGFLAESLSIADRRRHELELLREYHLGLLRAEVVDYPLERLHDDYVRGLTVRFSGVIAWLARVEIEDLEGRERALVEALVEPGNVLIAAADHDVLRRFDLL